jgi:hypothetical protein
MSVIPPRRLEHDLNVGDRIQVRQDSRPPLALAGHVGMVVEVFRLPRDSCMVRLLGDPDRQREWFFYSDEVVINNPEVVATEEI